jgi:hypothetical protein
MISAVLKMRMEKSYGRRRKAHKLQTERSNSKQEGSSGLYRQFQGQFGILSPWPQNAEALNPHFGRIDRFFEELSRFPMG